MNKKKTTNRDIGLPRSSVDRIEVKVAMRVGRLQRGNGRAGHETVVTVAGR